MTSITDFFVVASGRNVQSVHTLAEDLEDRLAEEGIEPRRKEGKNGARWIVLDYAQVIVHIFHPEERAHYNIERLWQDGTNDERFEGRNETAHFRTINASLTWGEWDKMLYFDKRMREK